MISKESIGAIMANTSNIVLLRCFLNVNDEITAYAVQTKIEGVDSDNYRVKALNGYGTLLDDSLHASDIIDRKYINSVADIRNDKGDVLYSHPNLSKEWNALYNPNMEDDPLKSVKLLILYGALPEEFSW